jgi:hypothetical protein
VWFDCCCDRASQEKEREGEKKRRHPSSLVPLFSVAVSNCSKTESKGVTKMVVDANFVCFLLL